MKKILHSRMPAVLIFYLFTYIVKWSIICHIKELGQKRTKARMPQENNSNPLFNSPSKSLRGLKGLVCNNNEASYVEEIIDDRELAQRKADEAGNNLTNSIIKIKIKFDILKSKVVVKFGASTVQIWRSTARRLKVRKLPLEVLVLD